MAERDEYIGRFWDELVSGTTSSIDIEPEDADLIRRAHLLYAEPAPRSARERARERVFDHVNASRMQAIAVPSAIVSIPTPALAPSPQPKPRSLRNFARQPRWALASVAALLILVLGVGSYVAVVPPEARIIGGGSGPKLVPAPHVPFDAGRIALLWETSGSEEHRLWQPIAVAMAPDGNVYVANAFPGTIEIFSPDGNHLDTIGEKGSGPGQFLFQSRGYSWGNLEFDAEGNLYVFDAFNHRVQKFAPDHTFIREWGTEGTENPGEFDLALGTVDDARERVYVVDRTGRFQIFDLNGNFLAQWDHREIGPGLYVNPWDVAVDSQGNIFVVGDESTDAYSEGVSRVQKFDASGNLIGGADFGSSLTFDASAFFLEIGPEDNLFISEYGTDSFWIVSSDGSLIGDVDDASADILFDSLSGIALDADGNLYVVSEALNQLLKLDVPPLD